VGDTTDGRGLRARGRGWPGEAFEAQRGWHAFHHSSADVGARIAVHNREVGEDDGMRGGVWKGRARMEGRRVSHPGFRGPKPEREHKHQVCWDQVSHI
jgi:hypothetical protein